MHNLYKEDIPKIASTQNFILSLNKHPSKKHCLVIFFYFRILFGIICLYTLSLSKFKMKEQENQVGGL